MKKQSWIYDSMWFNTIMLGTVKVRYYDNSIINHVRQ